MNDGSPADENLQTILVVDDTPENIDVLRGILESRYRVKVAINGEVALKVIARDEPDLILLDVMMPGMSGYQVCERLKSDVRTRHIPIVFVTAMSEVRDEKKGFDLGAVDYITKPVSAPIVLARVRTQLALYDQQQELAAQVRAKTEELHETRLEVIRRLGRAAEYRDNQTGLHVIRMSHYSRILALSAGIPEAEADTLLDAAPMHDIGKIGIPDRVLLKEGPLNDEEWEVMKKHPAIGAGIIGKHAPGLLENARIIALTHHEKWDGSGYPRNLKGEEIPLMGRIISIADVYDALTTARPYKRAWTHEQALEQIRKGAGVHFDPDLVDALNDSLEAFLEIRAQYAENAPPVPRPMQAGVES